MMKEEQMLNSLDNPSFLHLSRSQSLVIKKDYFNVGCCNDKNQYDIYTKEPYNSTEPQLIYSCYEESSFLQRSFFSGNWREFKISMKDTSQSASYFPSQNNVILEFVKPFSCTVGCINRPTMEIYTIESQKRMYLGKIRMPYSCMCSNYSLEVLDSHNNKKFVFQEQYLSRLIMCGFCCCPKGTINIIDESNSESQLKISYEKCYITQTNYELFFPSHYSTKDKLLLMSAVLMFDMVVIEEDQKKRKKPIQF